MSPSSDIIEYRMKGWGVGGGGQYSLRHRLQAVESRVQGSKNFSPSFLEGSTNLRTSSVGDYARSDMHRKVMALSRRFFYATDQSPIVKALSRMDILRRKQFFVSSK